MLRGMAEPPDPLPADPAELVRIIRDLEARNADLQAEVKTLKALIFGARSERAAVIDPDQGVLDLGDLAVEAIPAANDNADRTSGKPRPHPRRPASGIQCPCYPPTPWAGSVHSQAPRNASRSGNTRETWLVYYLYIRRSPRRRRCRIAGTARSAGERPAVLPPPAHRPARFRDGFGREENSR